MFLFRDVMDKQLVDCHGDKAGKVDDLLLALEPGRLPVVRAVVSGRGASAAVFPRTFARLAARLEERLLGVGSIEPVTVCWSDVTRIDVVVRLDVDRRQAGLTRTEESIWRRWIRPLPWSER